MGKPRPFAYRGLYLRDCGTLVLADLHLGRGHRAGVHAPIGAASAVRERTERLLSRFEPTTVVLAGDVLDAFETVPPGVPDRLDTLLGMIRDAGARPVLLAGNHDGLLAALVNEPVCASHRVGETVIGHGHEALPSAERYVIGHVHPALRIEGRKRACFLVGPAADGGELVVLPAASDAVRGTVIRRRRAFGESPLFPSDRVGAFRPIVHDESADETFVFPRLDRLWGFL